MSRKNPEAKSPSTTSVQLTLEGNWRKVDPETGLTELGRAITTQANLGYIRALVHAGADFTTPGIRILEIYNDTRYEKGVGSALELAMCYNQPAFDFLQAEWPDACRRGLQESLLQRLTVKDAYTYHKLIISLLKAGARVTPGIFQAMFNDSRRHFYCWEESDAVRRAFFASKPTLAEVYDPATWAKTLADALETRRRTGASGVDALLKLAYSLGAPKLSADAAQAA